MPRHSTYLGVVLQAQGCLEEAAACYRKAITIKPDYAEAHSNLLLVLYYFSNISGKDIDNHSCPKTVFIWTAFHHLKVLTDSPKQVRIL